MCVGVFDIQPTSKRSLTSSAAAPAPAASVRALAAFSSAATHSVLWRCLAMSNAVLPSRYERERDAGEEKEEDGDERGVMRGDEEGEEGEGEGKDEV